jgi:hypothetical protein
MSGQLTCGNCGHSWWSNASSARTRCGACRSAVYVPAHVRNGDTGDHADDWRADGEQTEYSGATVLVVIGLVVVAIIAGVVWLRHRRALTSTEPDGTTPLVIGAVTRWSCGHEADLSQPLAPGVPVAAAACPVCGSAGIVGQYEDGRFVPFGL